VEVWTTGGVARLWGVGAFAEPVGVIDCGKPGTGRAPEVMGAMAKPSPDHGDNSGGCEPEWPGLMARVTDAIGAVSGSDGGPHGRASDGGSGAPGTCAGAVCRVPVPSAQGEICLLLPGGPECASGTDSVSRR